MKVLLIGGGGREHALGWKIAQSPLLTKIYLAPGSPGLNSLNPKKFWLFNIYKVIKGLTMAFKNYTLCLRSYTTFITNLVSLDRIPTRSRVQY